MAVYKLPSRNRDNNASHVGLNLEKADISSKLSWKQYSLYYFKHKRCIFGSGLFLVKQSDGVAVMGNRKEGAGTEITKGICMTLDHHDSHARLQSGSHLGRLSSTSRITVVAGLQ
jgi:hypothetical protein